MRTTNPIFRNAQTLAEFANLVPARVDYFRNNKPGFVPDIWWKMRVFYSVPGERPLLWQFHQQTLHEIWQAHFPLDKCVKLIGAGTFPYEAIRDLTAKQNVLAPELANTQFANTAVAIPSTDPRYAEALTLATTFEIDPTGLAKYEKVYPYMQAVMALAIEPWRARVCVCGNRYVADIPARRFCSDKCFQKARKLAKRTWWGEHGEEWREGKQKAAKKPSKKGGK